MASVDLKSLLQQLDYDHCDAFRRRADWCRRSDRLDEESLVDYADRATGISKAADNFSDDELARLLVHDVIRPGPYTFETQLRRLLTEFDPTDALRYVPRKEQHACAEVYGYLRGELASSHDVHHEYSVDSNHRVDMHVREADTGREYLIEGKVAGNVNGDEALRHQIEFYQERCDHHEHTFLLVFVFDDDYWRTRGGGRQAQIDEYLREGTTSAIDDTSDCEPVVHLLPPRWR